MAIYSDVSVCTMALNMIGIDQTVSSLADTDDLSTVCNRWYEIARDEILESSKWPFAKKQEALGLVEEFTADTDEWAYSYRYPVDCLMVYRLVNGVVPVTTPIAFELRQDATGRLIMTDLEDAIVEATFAYDNTGEWTNKFALAVAAKLAEYIAIPLRVDASLAAMVRDKSAELLNRAQAASEVEGRNRALPASKYVTARGGFPAREMILGER